MRHQKYTIHAFSLIEIIITIMIVGIITTIAFVSFSNYSSQMRNTIRISHINDITSVIELYSVFSGKYPKPSNAVDVTASGWVLVWSQWVFWKDSMNETRKIFWDLRDPLYKNYYPYSTTSSRKEYQISYILEESKIWNQSFFTASDFSSLVPKTYASTFFDPWMLDPAVWLDANDINWDGSIVLEWSAITTWVNKGTRWSDSNGIRTHGTFTYKEDSVAWFPAVFVPKEAGLLFNNSSISQWEIYFVLHDSWWKAMGYGVQWTAGNYVIWAYHNYRNSLLINNAPNHLTTAPAIKNTNNREAFFYSFFTDGINYEFRNTGNFLSQWATNSIEWVNWAINRAWRFNRVNQNADWGIGEFIVFDIQLSQEAQYMIEGYLAHKWNLVQDLPSDHPYKDFPPMVPDYWDNPPIIEPIEQQKNPWAPIFLHWNYNNLFAHWVTDDGTHKIFVTPSIMSHDLINPNFEFIIENQKLVYSWYGGIPVGYNLDQDDYDTFWFNIEYPIAFVWTRQELASYSWIREIEEYLRYAYRYSSIFWDVADFFSWFGTKYVENILSNNIGINPIKPYYCNEILNKRLIYNLAKLAEIDATPTSSDSWFQGVIGINNGIKSTQWPLNKQYKMSQKGWYIEFTWEEDVPVGFMRIFNSVWELSSGLSHAEMKLFRHNDITPIYSHTLWDTTWDYVVDLDLEGIWQLHNDVRRIMIIADQENIISLRELEIFAWGNIEDWYYQVNYDAIWKRDTYTIYCDMTTDGWGWTKVWTNFIDKSFFERNEHPSKFQGYHESGNINNVYHNTLRNDIVWPYVFPEATVLRHTWNTNSFYRLVFDDISNIDFTSEIRLSAWIKWSSQSPFWYTIKYEDQDPQTYVSSDTYDGDISQWRYEAIRIPITDNIDVFSWDIGLWIDAQIDPFYITGLKLEIYYR